jgi:hypothetical protein
VAELVLEITPDVMVGKVGCSLCVRVSAHAAMSIVRHTTALPGMA